MDKIIIGVHGLGNKPPKNLLEKWWEQAISEGLTRSGYTHRKFDFELVYWADALHPVPLNPDETDKDSKLYLSERYSPAPIRKRTKPKDLKDRFIKYFKKKRDSILFNESMHENFPSFTDLIIKRFFKDLAIYLTQKFTEETKSDSLVKEEIRLKLISTLKKHKNKDILLITHSMGSIITYDVLVHSENDIKIDSLVTMGSPLGIPFIIDKLKSDLSSVPGDNNRLRTPENIKTEWINFADPGDGLAQKAGMRKIYKKNSHDVGPNMKLIYNDFESEGIENPHKSFGYLRTPELAYTINEFLNRGKSKINIWFTKNFDQFILWLTQKYRQVKKRYSKAK
jgi:Lecithin:cholesterol acyltransferase